MRAREDLKSLATKSKMNYRTRSENQPHLLILRTPKTQRYMAKLAEYISILKECCLEQTNKQTSLNNSSSLFFTSSVAPE